MRIDQLVTLEDLFENLLDCPDESAWQAWRRTVAGKKVKSQRRKVKHGSPCRLNSIPNTFPRKYSLSSPASEARRVNGYNNFI